MARRSFKANRLSSQDNAVFPDEIIIDEDERIVIYHKQKIIGSLNRTIPFDAIASICCEKHVIFADIVIETNGGMQVKFCGFTRGDANAIVKMLSF